MDVMQIITQFCDCLTKKSDTKHRRLWKSRRDKHLEAKAIARAYKLGRGRLTHKDTDK